MITLPPTRYILPNLFTISAAFCGFSSIWISTQAETPEQFYGSAALICLAVFLDGFDGRIARWVDGESKIGGQLDSLSDFLTFGVAPAMLAYAWGLRAMGTVGLVAVFLFAAAAMLRLARFNVQAEQDGGCSRYFTGLPAPMAGLAVALLIGVNSGVIGRAAMVDSAMPSLALFLILLGFLMISNVPFRTFKDIRPTRTNRLFIAAILATQLVVSFTVDFTVALSLGLIGYLTYTLTGGIIGFARVRGVRAQRDGTLVDDDDE